MNKDKALKLWVIFRATFLVGLTTFGGGLSMVAQMSHEFVDKRGWLDEKDMADYLAVSQSLPGVIAVNMSIMLGYRLAGVLGGITAAIGSVLPSLIVLCGVTVFYEAFIQSRILSGALRGIRGGVAALLFFTVVRLRKDSVRDVLGWILAIGAVGMMLFLDISPVWILLGGGLLGAVITAVRLRKEKRAVLDAPSESIPHKDNPPEKEGD